MLAWKCFRISPRIPGFAVMMARTWIIGFPLRVASRGGEMRHRGVDAALPVWDAHDAEGHLDSRERAQQHRLVQIAHVADPEDAALQPVEPATQRDIEPVEAGLAERIGVVAL